MVACHLVEEGLIDADEAMRGVTGAQLVLADRTWSATQRWPRRPEIMIPLVGAVQELQTVPRRPQRC